MTLKAKVMSGVRWTTASTVSVTVLQLLQLSILARFLSPSDFGLMAIVMVVIGFSQAFLDMGISNAIIHKRFITSEQLSTLYWVNVLAGAALFLLVCMVSPLVSFTYGEPELTHLIILVGLTFLIQPFGQQFQILWQKELRFSEIAKIAIARNLLSLVVSTGLAYAGYGVYALAYGTIAAVALQTLLFLIAGMSEHRPQIVFRWREIYDFLSFGMYQMGERTINYFNSQIDVILIGKLLGIEALGVYTVAKQITMRPAQVINPIVTKVSFPTMAKIQNDSQILKRVYLKTINYLSSVNFPIYAALIVVAPELVHFLFGDKWMTAVPILQILSVYGAFRSIGNPVGSLLLSKGRADLGFFWNLGLFFFMPIAIAISSPWGLSAIAWTLTALAAVLVLPSWFFLIRPLCGAAFREYIQQISIPLALSILAGIAGVTASNSVANAAWRLIVALSVGAVTYLLLSQRFNKIWIQEMSALSTRTSHNRNL